MVTKDHTTASTAEAGRKDLSRQEKEQRKKKVLTQETPSITHSIADAVVIKNGNYYFLTRPNGEVPLEDQHGFGLYYNDCRFLSGYELKMAGRDPNVLVSNAGQGFSAVFELTSPDIELECGDHIYLDQVGIKWNRILDAEEGVLFEELEIRNYSRKKIELPLSFTFAADFKDVFNIRGLWPTQPGTPRPPRHEKDSLVFEYDSADDLFRSLAVHFSKTPKEIEENCVLYNLALEPRGELTLKIALEVTETPIGDRPKAGWFPDLEFGSIEAHYDELHKKWLSDQMEIHSDSLLLNSLMDRSLNDLRTLYSHLDGQDYFAAGVPWFVTLFGRDSLITALQTLAFDRELAEETLRLLARYQGEKVDPWRDMEPGKILHEIRVGELARLAEIPHIPYYGSIDATPLFLILLERYTAWCGDMALFQDLKENIDRALRWIDDYGDLDGDGFVEYDSISNHGLVNQGWKDSGDAIRNADGSLADPPIALVEVQGYVYAAKLGMARLFEWAGEPDRAEALREQANQLRHRFNQEFWLDDDGFYALALQADNRPVRVMTSNPGHALWTGIADEQKAQKTVRSLMAADMFNGWGIRTLSSSSQECYNPTGYHLGTVWPHDNSIIASGFRRYRFDGEARKVFRGIFEASMHFDHYRLPELFSGFSRDAYHVPVRYPVACHPQAWAAGSVPYMLVELLGLQPEALDGRLHIIRPQLPDFVDRILLKGLRVGKTSLDLSFERTSGDRTGVNVLKVDGTVDVMVDAEA